MRYLIWNIAGGPGETLQRWSSIIGIVTAIVGNVLIALALNVQRYAHTRLHRERSQIRRQARIASKRSRNGGRRTVSYGTASHGDNSTSRVTAWYGHSDSDATVVMRGRDDGEDNNGHETEPLTASFRSEATLGTEEGDEDPAETLSYLKSPYWWIGQILITLGEMGNFLAYGFAPASIVSPLGVVALVSNCIIAPVMFKEKFRRRDFCGVVIAVGGVVTVVLSAKQEEVKLNPRDVWDAITTLAFEIYTAVTVCLIGLLMWASTRYGHRTIVIDLGLVGLFGGYTALATKGVSSMLSSALWRAFTTPVTYVLLVILLGTAIMQIRYVNKALQRFDSTQVIPVQFVMFTLCVILGSAILYRDFEKTTPEQAGKFVGGCLLTFFGVFLITSGRHQREEEEEELYSDEGVEETIGLDSHEGHATAASIESNSQHDVTKSSQRSSIHSPVGSAEAAKSVTSNALNAALRSKSSYSLAKSPAQESSPLSRMDNRQEEWNRSLPLKENRTLSTDDGDDGDSIAVTSYPPTPGCVAASNTHAVPSGRPMAPRPSIGSVRSISYHNTRGGPFISPSPMSSTVTTFVKDGILRPNEDGVARRYSIRRIRSSIRASLFFDDDGVHKIEPVPTATGQSARPLLEDNLARTLSGPAVAPRFISPPEETERARSHSVSDALGELLPTRRRKQSNPDNPDTNQAMMEDAGKSPNAR